MGEKNQSDIVNEPVQTADVRSYITFNKIKTAENAVKQHLDPRKGKESAMQHTVKSVTLTSNEATTP